MCATCGCGVDSVATIDLTGRPGGGHTHMDGDGNVVIHSHHDRDGHTHGDGDGHIHRDAGAPFGGQAVPVELPVTTTLTLEQQVLAKNDLRAARTRGYLEAKRTVAINVMGAPGAGKTTLLERTVADCCIDGGFAALVIEGDQATTLDGDRLHAIGVPVVQVNTGSGCHLDADMVAGALAGHDLADGGLVIIENVGNLVCPALFDLGEDARVVITSVTEGAGKPLKYPHAFRHADMVLLNKMDLLPYVDFDVGRFEAEIRQVNPRAAVLPLSAITGEGVATWYEWLSARRSAFGSSRTPASSPS